MLKVQQNREKTFHYLEKLSRGIFCVLYQDGTTRYNELKGKIKGITIWKIKK
jgi:hypothetical protein